MIKTRKDEPPGAGDRKNPWKMSLEFSGIVFTRVARDFSSAAAYLSRGSSYRHHPKLYIPTACIAGSLGTVEEVECFGLRTIAAPAGEYLTEVDLDGALIHFRSLDTGMDMDGPVTPVGAEPDFKKKIRENLGSYEPNDRDWRALAYSMDLRDITSAPLGDLDRQSSAKMRLPKGSLESRKPAYCKNQIARAEVLRGGKTLFIQRFADRIALQTDDITGRVRIFVAKQRPDVTLGIEVLPPEDRDVLRMSVTAHCCLRGDTASEDLDEYSVFLADGNTIDVQLKPYTVKTTDDHGGCPSIFSVE